MRNESRSEWTIIDVILYIATFAFGWWLAYYLG
jgi:hypothetical protein